MNNEERLHNSLALDPWKGEEMLGGKKKDYSILLFFTQTQI